MPKFDPPFPMLYNKQQFLFLFQGEILHSATSLWLSPTLAKEGSQETSTLGILPVYLSGAFWAQDKP